MLTKGMSIEIVLTMVTIMAMFITMNDGYDNYMLVMMMMMMVITGMKNGIMSMLIILMVK